MKGKLMPSLRMEGPYNFDINTIEEIVAKVSSGNFALGRKNEAGTFLVGRIGRSDTDLAAELKSWISKTDRPLFKFRYAISPRDAFGMECENFHDFVKNGKGKHPERPANTDWKCPRCNFYK
jgi:hypothetical protein